MGRCRPLRECMTRQTSWSTLNASLGRTRQPSDPLNPKRVLESVIPILLIQVLLKMRPYLTGDFEKCVASEFQRGIEHMNLSTLTTLQR